jgi:hypothetical protein
MPVPDAVPVSGLHPIHFQVILDMVDSLESPQSFLRHLLLIIRADRSPQDDSAFLRLEAEIAPLQVRVTLDG